MVLRSSSRLGSVITRERVPGSASRFGRITPLVLPAPVGATSSKCSYCSCSGNARSCRLTRLNTRSACPDRGRIAASSAQPAQWALPWLVPGWARRRITRSISRNRIPRPTVRRNSASNPTPKAASSTCVRSRTRACVGCVYHCQRTSTDYPNHVCASVSGTDHTMFPGCPRASIVVNAAIASSS